MLRIDGKEFGGLETITPFFLVRLWPLSPVINFYFCHFLHYTYRFYGQVFVQVFRRTKAPYSWVQTEHAVPDVWA